MKTTFKMMFSIAMMTFFIAIVPSFAQTSDTVIAYANPPGTSAGKLINDFINGDTTDSGQRNNPNRVYVLQQNGPIDTTYYISALIETKYKLNILGKKNPVTGKIPVIEAFINPDNSSPKNFIQADSGSFVILKDLYLLATRTDGTSGVSTCITTTGKYVTINIDSCIVENFNGNMIANNGDHIKFFSHNSEFRNIQSSFWQGGSVFWSNGGAIVDTLEFVNNTFFCVMRAAYGTPGYIGYLNFNHNTLFMGVGGTLLATQISNANITNNIFYGLMAHGVDSSYIKAGSANAAHQGFGVIMVDTLSTLLNPPYSLTEAQRNINVKNNAYFWPQGLYTYWQTVTDTANNHPGLITPPAWMNDKTKMLFSNTTLWPGLYAANNDSVDPGFDASLVASAVDSCTKFVNLIWTAAAVGQYRWSQYPADPFNYTYPVSENLRYSNTALQSAGTDGKALGDLNWFPEQLVTDVEQTPKTTPNAFNLSQNYPNPFNPSTVINYSIPKEGMVTLKVFNILGQEVATLVNSNQKMGIYNITFNATRLSSGIYFYSLKANGSTLTKKMMLIK